MLFFLFFCSGLSGLIYEIIWVREFGNIFGNTIYSASLVTAVFMLGLGAGGYAVGTWADRRYAAQPGSLLRVYGFLELAIAAMGAGISLTLPHLGRLSALTSSYVSNEAGWFVLSLPSHLARGAVAIILLAPIALLMGGTLTLLIRHLVGRELDLAGWRIAALYGVNTAGAAIGCFLTDSWLVPVAGLRGAQMTAVLVNIVAAAGALTLASAAAARIRPQVAPARSFRRGPFLHASEADPAPSVLGLTGVAAGLAGFAAMGMEMLWFRHFTLLLGGFRAVFSTLLAIILAGIGAGSLIGGMLSRRASRPASWLMVAQGLFVASTLATLAAADVEEILAATRALLATAGAEAPAAGTPADTWLTAVPILMEVGLPAILMGVTFPLANAIVQRREGSVGRGAGVLYLSNAMGAVAGALATGFLLLPALGIQRSAMALTLFATAAAVPLYVTTRTAVRKASWRHAPEMALATSMCLAVGAIGLWLRLPADHAITRAMPRPLPGEQLLAIKEGVAELVAVKEGPGAERQLLTNGHAMSATGRLAQRYMRALAHLPLLSMDRPARVLVIGFGVGNTAHAAVLHPSVERVDVADLSSDVLSYAGYFGDTNGGVLSDPRTVVYVNDGRQHLRMQPPASYDLITLEPPPLTLSGVGALYAREFYELARTRLEPGGYLSQWLPFYQVPPSTLFSMIRAFVDVFPQAVLLGGTDEDLLLVGTTAPRIEVDPARLAAALARAPLVEADLRRLGLGSVLEIAGTFVASARTLDEATRRSRPTTDDRPIQEYVTGSRLTAVRVAGVPSTIVQVGQVGAWCPGCVAGTPVPFIEELNAYLALLDPVYRRATLPAGRSGAAIDVQRLAGEHEYLREVLADWAARQNVRGATLAAEGRIDEAIIEFQSALRFTPNSAETHWNLGRALMDRGITEAALDHLRRSVILDPGHGPARYDLGSALLDLQRPDEALTELRAAVRLMPASAEAWNHLGIALGSQGKLDEAIAVFERALALRPALPTAQQNLAMAQQALSARGAARRRSGPR